MSPKKVIFSDLDLHGFGDNRIEMGLTIDQEIDGITGKEGIDTWDLAGLAEDQVVNVVGAVFVFNNVGAVAKDSALFKAESFHLGWKAITPENEAENEEWTD